MRSAVRRLAACLLCCGTALAVSPVVALGEGAASKGAAPVSEGSRASSSLGGSLVTPGSPVEGEEAKAAEEAKLANPDAVAEREASQTKYEGLNAEGAEKTDGEAFPKVIDEPAGGPPKLPAGESITGYPNDNVAQLDLPEDRHGVLESLLPMAVETAPGQRMPVDLGLSEEGGVFAPKVPFVPVRIPKRLSEGVQLGTSGVSVTPIDAQGSPLAGEEGALDGASVLYANTLTDADTVVKPTTAGFEMDTFLRSVESPEQLYFRVGLPEGASLVQTGDGSGPVEVIDEGAMIATILPPGAHDAAGTAVPVSMSVSGVTLTLMVGHHAGGYLYPVEVDPEFRSAYDENLGGATLPTHWKFCTSLSSKCEHTELPFSSSGWGGTTLSDDAIAEYKTGQSAYFLYQSEGDSHVYEANLTASAHDAGTNIETYLQLAGSVGVEETVPWEEHVYRTVCAYSKGNNEKCERREAEKAPDEYGAAGNWLHFEQSAYGSGSSFTNTMEKVDVSVAQEGEPETSFNTSAESVAGRVNVLHGAAAWLGPHNGAFEVYIHDPGVGISFEEMRSLGGSWNVTHKFLEEGKCSGVFCAQTHNEVVTYSSGFPDGEDEVQAEAKDSVGKWAKAVGPFFETVKVDATPPRNLTLAGLPSSGVIDEGELHLQGRATDGTAPTPSSGIKRLELGLDGFEIPGGKVGSCSPGPCAASGEWTLDGEGIGAGKHTLELVAEDNAGNIEIAKYTVTVRHAGALSVGPGSVNPLTGALHLSSNDVSLSGGRGSLGISRSYNSRQLTGGELGPLGLPWKLSVSGSQEIEQEPTGSVVLVSPSGGRTTFESNGKGGFVAPKGDENLVLTDEVEGEKVKAYLLKDPKAGTTVKYARVGGAGPWVIASSEGALSKTNGEKETVEWERLEGVTRPKLAIAPAPKSVTCSPAVKEPKELAVGCRALSFTYATSTTATGEAPSEWKAYKGRLMTVSFTAYNPATKAMETKVVAEYAYDKQGRLRAAWDPRISPALTTTYGYDSEGHVTSVNPAGVQPWLFHYGTTARDSTAGRLLSVTRPPVSHQSASKEQTELKEADERPAPADTGLPTLSSTNPVIGTTLSIASNGTWSNSPLAYSDAWEDCYTYESKETCTLIPGAVNSSYTPQPRDAGYTLRAQVTAVNADGSSVATTTASAALAGVAPAYLRKFGEKGSSEKQFNAPVAAAIDHEGNVWLVDHNNDRVQEWSATGTWLHTYGAKGTKELQFESPEGIAIDTNAGSPSYGDVYVADKGNNRIEELSPEGKYIRAFGTKGKEPGQLTAPEGIAVVPAGVTSSATSGEVWVGDSGNDRVDEFSETGEYIGSFGVEGSGNGQLKGPDGIAFSGEDAYVVDSDNDRVQEFSMSGQYVAKFGIKGTGSGQFEAPYGIATEPVSGDLYVADSGNNRVQEFNPTGAFLVAYGKKGEGSGEFSSPDGVAVNSAGDAYVADSANNRVQELEPKYSTNNPLPEPPALGTSAVSTIDYNVPVTGSGAPHKMTAAELEKWGQKDDPTEATAVFPPDEPMGWPAKDYKRASITYYDEFGRTVNHASPSGGIATSEYNEYNEVVRSLSADNREAALKEGTKSKEASELLDTKSLYWEGGELNETTGPEHKIRLANGTERQARNQVRYSFNQGAPAGEKYDLVTRAIDDTVYEGKYHEERITTTSYSGQENLGWELRKPTSVTTEAGGLKLTHTTFYNRFTGQVVETRGPAAGGEGLPLGAPVYSKTLTAAGTSSLSKPADVATDKEGHAWVTDTENSRVEEFSPSGEYMSEFGVEGTGNGDFKKPQGIAIDKEGNVWVADTGDDRVEEMSSTGTFIRAFGSEGTETGKFKEPKALTIDSSGNVWVADTKNNRVQEFSSTGTYLRESTAIETYAADGLAADSKGDVWVASAIDIVTELSSTAAVRGYFGKEGGGNGEFKGPAGLAVSGEDIFVVDRGNSRVQEFKITEKEGKVSGEYITKFGSSGSGNGAFKEPQGIAIDKEGDLWVADAGNNRIQEFNSELKYKRQITTANSSLGAPDGMAVDKEGHVWVADTLNNRVDEFSSAGTYLKRFGTEGTGNVQFKKPQGIAVDKAGNVWVADTNNNRVEELSSTGEFIKAFGSEGTETGKFKKPEALTIDSSGNVWVADTGNNRVQEFSSTGTYLRENTENTYDPSGITADASGDVFVSDATIYQAVIELSSTAKLRQYIGKVGEPGSGNGQFKEPAGLTISGEDLFVVDSGNSRVQEFAITESGGKASAEYLAKFGTSGNGNGQFKEPQGIAIDKEGDLWAADAGNNRIQEFTPNPAGQHAAQMIYYSAGANAAYPACGGHPEWAELPCQSQPAVQPGTAGLPSLPVVTDEAYNMWDEPETVTESFAKIGSYAATTRTKKITYDSAGRLLTSEETSSPVTGSTLPKVTDVYSSETGAMVEQSTTAGEATKTSKSVYDTLARLTEYTDADSNTTQYVYSGPVNDGQVEEVNYGGKKGSQIYSYNETTKALEKLLDVGPEGGMGAGMFTAAYDVEGRMTSETYPNGMTAKYAFNPAGEATGLEYEKTTHCTEKCVWFSETISPSIHGEVLARTSTLAKEEYTYDGVGRLIQVNETPTGKGCKTRIYAYDEDSDRTSETTRESATETCSTTGGTEEKHTYDPADRLIDSSVEYETLGNQTKVPAADAGEHEITASFYVDNQVATQKENGETTSYIYDPAGRPEKTVSEGTTKATVIVHYPGPGEAVSWTCEENAKECEEGKAAKWTRNIAGIDGALAATQHDSESAVLQVHDLEGNVIATAADSETETKLLTTYNPTEFGVPVNGTPPTKYSWLGASGYATEQASGQANPGGSTYVPQLGAPLQTEPVVSPGVYANGSYNGAVFSPSPSAEALAQSDSYGAGAPVRAAERLQAQKEETEKQAYENECHIASCEQHNGPGEGNCEADCEVGEGEEEGVATGGDPFKCEVVSPYPLPTKPGRFKVRGGYYCEAYDETDQELLLHISAKVEVCLEEELAVSGVYGPDRCEITTYADRQAAGFEYEASCSPGHNYRTWTWVYWWGVGPMYHNPAKRSGSVEKCP
jgi:DNA-binding beta-propeller fold protein YncE